MASTGSTADDQRSFRRRVSVLALGACVLAAGCAQTAPAPSSVSTGPTASASQPAPDYDDGPLYPYRELARGNLPPNTSQQERNRHYAQQEGRIEELIAACMAAQGFEYVPSVREDEEIAYAEEWDQDDREWVSRYGYGINDYPGRVPPNQEPVVEDSSEPMGEAEEAAFQEALVGRQADGEDAYDWRNLGCRGAAEHEVIGYRVALDPLSQPVAQAIEEFYFSLDYDPAFLPLEAEWSACMAELDYPGFERKRDTGQAVEELRDGYFPSDDGSEHSETNAPTFASPDDPAYAELIRQEVALALADLDCREQTGYTQRHLQLQFELEQQFVDDHREELAAMKHRAEQGS